MKLDLLHGAIHAGTPFRARGSVIAVRGPILTARIPSAALGDLCTISAGERSVPARVIGFTEDSVSLAPFEDPAGIHAGCLVTNTGRRAAVRIPFDPRGAILDALGRPVEGASIPSAHQDTTEIEIDSAAPPPFGRSRISEQLLTGVNALDAACSVGRGQRLGIFAPAGAGKSTLLGMLARHSAADVNVIALVGERGREVREIVEDTLGAEGLSRSVVIVSTSDESAPRRALAAYTATAIAEHYRAQGLDVLLLLDSLTRAARALREMGLAAGELPTRSGYPPSVFGELPRLLERAGNDGNGSITAFYTVLTSEEAPDPIDEEIKSILDGHVTLSRSLALEGLRPAIDLTGSISRVMHALQSDEYMSSLEIVLSLLNRLRRDRDVLVFGGKPDPELSVALELEQDLKRILRQPLDRRSDHEAARTAIVSISAEARRRIALARSESLPYEAQGIA